MSPSNPGQYSKGIGLKVSEAEHQSLKMLAASEKKSIKAVIFDALDKVFPEWRKNSQKRDEET